MLKHKRYVTEFFCMYKKCSVTNNRYTEYFSFIRYLSYIGYCSVQPPLSHTGDRWCCP